MDATMTPRWGGVVGRLARIGALPADNHEEALRKETLVLYASISTALAVVWVATYWALGLHLSAAIPFAYQIASLISLVVFATTKRFLLFRRSQLSFGLVLPFLLQLSLGGFVSSSGVVLWSFMAPLGALLFSGRRSGTRWFVAFLALIVASAVLDPLLTNEADIPTAIVVTFFAMNVLGVTGTTYFLLDHFVGERDRAAEAVAIERERSELLLLNVLPKPIAERLKAGEFLIADGSEEAGVLFADIAGFTPMSEAMAPEEVVQLLDRVFTVFDTIAEEHGVEKIKTIGDAYMAASGLLASDDRHAEQLAEMALAMQREAHAIGAVELRIGIDIGPVVAGVIGRKKFIYDLWGDTVNTASRMESHGIPGTIQATERARDRLASAFEFEDRGAIEVKGKGSMRTYLLVGHKPDAPAQTLGYPHLDQ